LLRQIACALSFAYLILILNPIQAASALIYPFSKPLCRRINRWCARSVWGLWVLMAERFNGIDLRFTGDRITPRENAMIISNHQSIADVMVLLCFGWRARRLADMKWFVKDIIKYVPGPGWGMFFLDCIFLKRKWGEDKASIDRIFGKYQAEAIPLHLVSFLEGTRITEKKLAEAQAFAEARGLPVPKHTLVPRTKGFVATMTGLADHLDAVYDVTIGYHGDTPSLLDCFVADVATIDVHVRRYTIDELPTDEPALIQWAQDRFADKDDLLAAHRANGEFPGALHPVDVRVSDWLRPENRWDRQTPLENA